MKLGIGFKISLLAFFLVLVTAGTIGIVLYKDANQVLIHQKLDYLKSEMQQESIRLQLRIDTLRSDLLTLAGTPPIQGIVRSRQAGGADPLEGSTEDLWRQRLAIIFTEFLRYKPAYFQLSYIGVTDGGREILRVQRSGDAIVTVPERDLQPEGWNVYFQKTIQLGLKQIHFSEVALKQNKGHLIAPHTRVMRASVPVHTPKGAVFGVVSIAMDFYPPAYKLALDHNLLIASDSGDILRRLGRKGGAGLDIGGPNKIQDVYPELAELFKPGNTLREFSIPPSESNQGHMLYFLKVFFDSNQPSLFFGLAMDSNYQSIIATEAAVIRGRITLLIIGLIVGAGLLAFLFSRILIRPLRQITRATEGFADEQFDAPLPVKAGGEIGVLARSFGTMVQKVRDRNAALKEIRTKLETLVARRTSELAAANGELKKEISERLHALKTLGQTNDFLRSILESPSDVSIISTDLEKNILFWNKGAEIMLGYTAREMIGCRNMDILYPDDEESKKKVKEVFSYVIKNKKSVSGEVEEVTKSGRKIWVKLTISPRFDERGNLIGVLGVGENVTQRKQAEENLNKRTELLQLLQGVAVAANEAKTIEEAMQSVLDQVCVALGWSIGHLYFPIDSSREELVSAKLWYLQHPERFDDFRQITESASLTKGQGLPGQVLASGEPAWTMDITWDKTCTRYKWAKGLGGLACPVWVKGEVVGALEFFSSDMKKPDDRVMEVICQVGSQLGRVIERKDAEQALMESKELSRLIIDMAGDAFISIDKKGVIDDWSFRAEEMFGWASWEALGKGFTDLIIPSTLRETYIAKVKGFQGTEGSQVFNQRFEFAALHRDGREFPVEIAISFLRHGGAFMFNLFVHDISDRKLMQVQLNHAQKMESIGQLAAGIAHEINTPLQYIGDNTRFLQDSFTSIADILEESQKLLQAGRNGSVSDKLVESVESKVKELDLDFLMEEIPEAIKQTLGGIERVTKIVHAMKEFSHPGADKKTPSDLNKAIETTLNVSRNEWKYAADMEKHFDPELPLVPCMIDDFQQIILNLVVNAAHAIMDTPEGKEGKKGTITISTKRVREWVEVRVQDTGNGIPEEIRPKIFDPFFTTKEVGRGTGQGLSIVHTMVVKKHSGTISFETETGKGTTFMVRLPLSPENHEERLQESEVV